MLVYGDVNDFGKGSIVCLVGSKEKKKETNARGRSTRLSSVRHKAHSCVRRREKPWSLIDAEVALF